MPKRVPLRLEVTHDWGTKMPKFLEKKLKSEYGAKSAIPYKIMNKLGAMRGNKETAKGKAMQAKHSAKMKGMKLSKLMKAV